MTYSNIIKAYSVAVKHPEFIKLKLSSSRLCKAVRDPFMKVVRDSLKETAQLNETSTQYFRQIDLKVYHMATIGDAVKALSLQNDISALTAIDLSSIFKRLLVALNIGSLNNYKEIMAEYPKGLYSFIRCTVIDSLYQHYSSKT